MPPRYQFTRSIENLIANLRGIPEDFSPIERKQPEGIDTLLNNLLTKYKIGVESLEDRIRENWPQIVGLDNAKHCHPSRIERETTLIVAVANPVIRQELEFHKAILLANLRKLEGGKKIRAVFFKAG